MRPEPIMNLWERSVECIVVCSVESGNALHNFDKNDLRVCQAHDIRLCDGPQVRLRTQEYGIHVISGHIALFNCKQAASELRQTFKGRVLTAAVTTAHLDQRLK